MKYSHELALYYLLKMNVLFCKPGSAGGDVSGGQKCDSMFSFSQNAIVSIKELCGLPPIASLKQCLLTLSSRLITSDNTPSVSLVMKDSFPYLEPLGAIPDVQKKMLTAYDLVGNCDSIFFYVCVCVKSQIAGTPLWNSNE